LKEEKMGGGLVRTISWLVTLVLAVALFLRLGWVYFERHREVETPPERVAYVPKELDTRDLKILNFYSPSLAVRGEPQTICYGVLNAVSVKLDPPLADVTPSLNRCVEVVLHKETQLTLTATGRQGETTEVTFLLGVTEPRAEFKSISIATRTVKRGEPQTVCYTTKNATVVRLQWGGKGPGTPLPPGENQCYRWYPALSGAKLTAESPGGRESVDLPFKVRP
jgi:hypothetical protein